MSCKTRWSRSCSAGITRSPIGRRFVLPRASTRHAPRLSARLQTRPRHALKASTALAARQKWQLSPARQRRRQDCRPSTTLCRRCSATTSATSRATRNWWPCSIVLGQSGRHRGHGLHRRQSQGRRHPSVKRCDLVTALDVSTGQSNSAVKICREVGTQEPKPPTVKRCDLAGG